MEKKRINSETLDLPDEIIGKILIKFPVKILLSLKCVSKSWCRVISSKEFIRDHLKNRSTSTDLTHHKVILTSYDTSINKRISSCSLKYVLDELGESLVIDNLDHISIRNLSLLSTFVRILGLCNGLMLLEMFVERTTLVLWNPSTREAREIPSPLFARERGYGWQDFKYGLGYDDATDDYKVVCISYIRRPFLTQIFNCRTNSWREIENFPKVLPQEVLRRKSSGQLVNGRLHWLAEEGGVWDIVSLSLVDEKYEVMPWPDNILVRHDSQRTLGNLGGYLSLVIYESERGMYVWVMKKYGEAKSWTKIWTSEDFVIHRYIRPEPLWLLKNGDVALAFSAASELVVAVYDVENKVCKSTVGIVVDSHISFEHNVYVESLVSPFGEEQLGQ